MWTNEKRCQTSYARSMFSKRCCHISIVVAFLCGHIFSAWYIFSKNGGKKLIHFQKYLDVWTGPQRDVHLMDSQLIKVIEKGMD